MTNQVCVRPVLYVNENDFDADTRARRLAERQPLERLDAIGARFLRHLVDARRSGPRIWRHC